MEEPADLDQQPVEAVVPVEDDTVEDLRRQLELADVVEPAVDPEGLGLQVPVEVDAPGEPAPQPGAERRE